MGPALASYLVDETRVKWGWGTASECYRVGTKIALDLMLTIADDRIRLGQMGITIRSLIDLALEARVQYASTFPIATSSDESIGLETAVQTLLGYYLPKGPRISNWEATLPPDLIKCELIFHKIY